LLVASPLWSIHLLQFLAGRILQGYSEKGVGGIRLLFTNPACRFALMLGIP
jgi:hypothetical protein